MSSIVAALERGKRWLEGMAQRPLALAVLLCMAFIEASVAPVPPDLLFFPLALARPRWSFVPASVCVLGSVSGAIAGYFIGLKFTDTIGMPLLQWSGASQHVDALLAMYRDHGFVTLLLAGFTNIPFFVFTIVAGFKSTLGLTVLLSGALAGRALRFYLLALLFMLFGPAVKAFLDRHIMAFSICMLVLFAALLILAWL